jgi:GTP-binding protein
MEFTKHVRDRLHFIPWAPIIYISALSGQRIHTVLETGHSVWQNRFIRIPTSELNQIIRDAVSKHAPATKGQQRLKIFYATQVRTAPPVFLLHINNRKLLHFTYERYLENQIREHHPFTGTPIRISVRERKQKDQ